MGSAMDNKTTILFQAAPIGHTSARSNRHDASIFQLRRLTYCFVIRMRDPSDVNYSSHGCSIRTVPSGSCPMSCLLVHASASHFGKRGCGVCR
jgi:hypothetical protein